MKLYEFPPTRSIRVRWTLQELGVDFEGVFVNMLTGEHKSPDYLKVNPAGKIPALVDGDLVLTESVAIVLYLGEKFPEKGLVPTDLKLRTQICRWLLFAATELEQQLSRIARHTSFYPESKRISGEVPLAREDFQEIAHVLEEHITGRQFVIGNSITVADIVLAYRLDWANEVQLLGRFPQMRSYMERMYERPQAPMRIAAALRSVGL